MPKNLYDWIMLIATAGSFIASIIALLKSNKVEKELKVIKYEQKADVIHGDMVGGNKNVNK
jgi:hypothetical protein